MKKIIQKAHLIHSASDERQEKEKILSLGREAYEQGHITKEQFENSYFKKFVNGLFKTVP